MSLVENQYKIGDVLFGQGTPIRVSKFEPGGYDVNIRDRNVDLTDEVAFGFDSYTPQPIAFEMSVIDNYDMRFGPNIVMAGWKSGPQYLEQLKKEWRADPVRRVWSSMKSLEYKKNGNERVVFGRPRKFTEVKTGRGAEFIPVVAEFLPCDTFSYSNEMFGSQATIGLDGTIARSGGEGETWIQFLIQGPINQPRIVVDGFWEVQVDVNLASGKVLEINSSPWQRRVIDSDSNNLSAKLIGDSAYLGDMKLPPGETVTFSISGSGTSSETKCVATWREAYLAY